MSVQNLKNIFRYSVHYGKLKCNFNMHKNDIFKAKLKKKTRMSVQNLKNICRYSVHYGKLKCNFNMHKNDIFSSHF
jgi:hypothetical protein